MRPHPYCESEKPSREYPQPLISKRSLTGIKIQAIVDAVGVSKGGFFYHFKNKQNFIESIFGDILKQLDAEIDARIAKDPRTVGSFTRAYVEALFSERSEASPWSVLMVSSITDPGLKKLWSQWMDNHLERRSQFEKDEILEVVRFAADGIWLAQMMEDKKNLMPVSPNLVARLIALTYEASNTDLTVNPGMVMAYVDASVPAEK